MAMPMGGYAMANVAPGVRGQLPCSSSLTSSRFLKGLVIGGAAAYLLTNDQVQRAVIKGTVKVWTSGPGRGSGAQGAASRTPRPRSAPRPTRKPEAGWQPTVCLRGDPEADLRGEDDKSALIL